MKEMYSNNCVDIVKLNNENSYDINFDGTNDNDVIKALSELTDDIEKFVNENDVYVVLPLEVLADNLIVINPTEKEIEKTLNHFID